MNHVYNNQLPTVEQLNEFFSELVKHGIKKKTIDLFVRRAELSPIIRLEVNLKEMLKGKYLGSGGTVVKEGVTPEEREALIETDSSNLPEKYREICHGLLNIHARWVFYRAMRGMCLAAHECHDRHIGKV